jgi:hypothetical protein
MAEGTAAEPQFRYWIDFFSYIHEENGTLEYALALEAAGGQRTGGALKRPEGLVGAEYFQALANLMGSRHMDEWDVLYTASRKEVERALERARPGQLVAGIPGATVITRKSTFFRTLEKYYGKQGAWSLVPATFLLPNDYDQWQAWVKAHPDKVSLPGLGLI